MAQLSVTSSLLWCLKQFTVPSGVSKEQFTVFCYRESTRSLYRGKEETIIFKGEA